MAHDDVIRARSEAMRRGYGFLFGGMPVEPEDDGTEHDGQGAAEASPRRRPDRPGDAA